MSERSMRERLAMALWADQFPDVPWDVAEERQREDHLGHIDAVLTELETPTEGMIDEAFVNGPLSLSGMGGSDQAKIERQLIGEIFTWMVRAIRDGK